MGTSFLHTYIKCKSVGTLLSGAFQMKHVELDLSNGVECVITFPKIEQHLRFLVVCLDRFVNVFYHHHC